MSRQFLIRDFVVAAVWHELAVERLRRAAGLAPVPREIVMRRFFTFVGFLRDHGLTTRTVTEDPALVHEFSELCRSDLTAEGSAFVRAAHGHWLNRLGRDEGEARERARLVEWLRQFRQWADRAAAGSR